MNKTNMATPSMGFTPEDMKNISNVLGYTGEPSGFADYLSKNPQAHDSFMGIQKQRLQFDNGGFVATQHMANGGLSQRQEDYIKQNTVDGNFQVPGFLGVMVNAPDGSGRQVNAREAYYMQNPDFRPEVLRPFLDDRGLSGAFFDTEETFKNRTTQIPQQAPPTTGQVDLSQVQVPQIGVETAQRLQQPALPAGGVYTAAQTPTEAAQSVAPSTALITGDVRVAEAGQAQAAQAIAPTATTAAAITAAQAAPDVRDVAAQTAAATASGATRSSKQQQLVPVTSIGAFADVGPRRCQGWVGHLSGWNVSPQ